MTQFDSDDEREAAAFQVSLIAKDESQHKKKNKNGAKLPRTHAHRTLSQMTSDLTAAGLDTSRLEERAIMLAKVKGAGVQGKRKRGDDDDGMDVDMDGEGDEAPELMDGGEEWMDVDGEQQAPRKKTKTNEGRVVAKREPRSNRSLAGMRDDAVRLPSFPLLLCCYLRWRETDLY